MIIMSINHHLNMKRILPAQRDESFKDLLHLNGRLCDKRNVFSVVLVMTRQQASAGLTASNQFQFKVNLCELFALWDSFLERKIKNKLNEQAVLLTITQTKKFLSFVNDFEMKRCYV